MNIFEDIPYNNNTLGTRKIIDKKHLLVMQIALKGDQKVPIHSANSNVHLLVLKGNISVNLNGKFNNIKKGEILPVAFKTKMEIKNLDSSNTTFLVLKTPNPSEMNL